MGLLDDLKQQAESRKQEEQTNQAQRTQNLQAVNATLREAFHYFTELSNSLNVLKPEVARSFYLEGTTKLDNLMQCNYRVRDRRKIVDQRDYFEEVTLRFSWAGSQPIKIEKQSPMSIQRLRDALGGYGLRFECREIKNDRGLVESAVFTIEPEVIASAMLTGNWDTGNIRLSLKNIDLLGTIDYQYDPTEVDYPLFEELAKLLLGKPNNLRNLGKYQEMIRTTPRLRSTIADVQYPSVEQPSAPESGSKSGLLDNLKSLLKR